MLSPPTCSSTQTKLPANKKKPLELNANKVINVEKHTKHIGKGKEANQPSLSFNLNKYSEHVVHLLARYPGIFYFLYYCDHNERQQLHSSICVQKSS